MQNRQMFKAGRCALILGMLATSLPSLAASPLVAFSRAELSDFRFHLEDLDPDDGVTPWIQFNKDLGFRFLGNSQSVKEGSWQNQSVSPTYVDSTVFFSPSGAGTVGSLSGVGLRNPSAGTVSLGTSISLDDALGTGNLSHNRYARATFAETNEDFSPLLWTMSANTRLVVEGRADVGAGQLFTSTYKNQFISPSLPYANSYVLTETQLSLSIFELGPDMTQKPWGSTEVFLKAINEAWFTTAGYQHSTQFANQGRDFVATFSNSTADDMAGGLNLKMYSTLTYWRDGSGVPQVNEPSVLLMGLGGLGVMAWRKRRRF